MSSPASSWWEASLAESSGLRGSTEMASSRQHPNSLQGWLGLLSLAATLPALSFCEPAPAQPGHHLEVQSISLLCWITRGGKQAVPVQSEAPVQCGCCGVSTPQDPNAQTVRGHQPPVLGTSSLFSLLAHRGTQTSICTYCHPVPASSGNETDRTVTSFTIFFPF